MKFIPRAGRVLGRAWSVRASILSSAFTAAAMVLPYAYEKFPIPFWVFAGCAFLLSLAVPLLRILPQKGLGE